jgi:hypothetical protein
MAHQYLKDTGLDYEQVSRCLTNNPRNRSYLNQILYYYSISKINRNSLIWVARSRADMAADLGMSEAQVKKAQAQLVADGVIATKQMIFKNKNIGHVTLTPTALLILQWATALSRSIKLTDGKKSTHANTLQFVSFLWLDTHEVVKVAKGRLSVLLPMLRSQGFPFLGTHIHKVLSAKLLSSYMLTGAVQVATRRPGLFNQFLSDSMELVQRQDELSGNGVGVLQDNLTAEMLALGLVDTNQQQLALYAYGIVTGNTNLLQKTEQGLIENHVNKHTKVAAAAACVFQEIRGSYHIAQSAGATQARTDLFGTVYTAEAILGTKFLTCIDSIYLHPLSFDDNSPFDVLAKSIDVENMRDSVHALCLSVDPTCLNVPTIKEFCEVVNRPPHLQKLLKGTTQAVSYGTTQAVPIGTTLYKEGLEEGVEGSSYEEYGGPEYKALYGADVQAAFLHLTHEAMNAVPTVKTEKSAWWVPVIKYYGPIKQVLSLSDDGVILLVQDGTAVEVEFLKTETPLAKIGYMATVSPEVTEDQMPTVKEMMNASKTKSVPLTKGAGAPALFEAAWREQLFAQAYTPAMLGPLSTKEKQQVKLILSKLNALHKTGQMDAVAEPITKPQAQQLCYGIIGYWPDFVSMVKTQTGTKLPPVPHLGWALKYVVWLHESMKGKPPLDAAPLVVSASVGVLASKVKTMAPKIKKPLTAPGKVSPDVPDGSEPAPTTKMSKPKFGKPKKGDFDL